MLGRSLQEEIEVASLLPARPEYEFLRTLIEKNE